MTPMLDRIDEVVNSAGPGVVSPPQRREFMASYVEELARDGGIIALLYRDPVVRKHPVGQRFADQHLRMRALLGAVDEPASAIRTTIALRSLETAVVELARSTRPSCAKPRSILPWRSSTPTLESGSPR